MGRNMGCCIIDAFLEAGVHQLLTSAFLLWPQWGTGTVIITVSNN